MERQRPAMTPAAANLNGVPLVIVAAILLLVMYAGGYAALSRPLSLLSGEAPVPAYRWGGAVAATLFYPASRLDQAIRPTYWDKPGPCCMPGPAE